MTTNVCHCGHAKTKHEHVLPVDAEKFANMGVTNASMTELGGCLGFTGGNQCKCDDYVEQRRPPDWLILARVADFVRRTDKGLTIVRNPKRKDAVDWTLEVKHVINEFDFTEETTLNEEHELSEYLGAALLEHAEMVRKRHEAPETIDAERVAAISRQCPVCVADPGQWCQPTHDGERASGTWLHPPRWEYTFVDAKMVEAITKWSQSNPTRMPDLFTVGAFARAIRELHDRRYETAPTPATNRERVRDDQQQALIHAVYRVDRVAAMAFPNCQLPDVDRPQYEQRITDELRRAFPPAVVSTYARADRRIVATWRFDGFVHEYPSVMYIPQHGSVAQARQSCVICSGTGWVIDHRDGHGSASSQRCTCAAGQSTSPHTGRQQGAVRMGKHPAPAGASVSQGERSAMAAKTAVALGHSVACGCTHGSPCEEHGPYW